MITLTNINKTLRTPAGPWSVLRDIELQIAEGEFVSIMGPSGAGKTSLLSLLGLLDSEFEGDYVLAGKSVRSLRDAERKQLAASAIGFVFQHYHLIDDLSVAENIELPLDYRGVPKAERRARVNEVLSEFELAEKSRWYPRMLSGGQQQLVAVARAIAPRPKLLLADEPTGALHSSQGEMIMQVLQRLNQAGTTIVQVTHHPDYAQRAGRVLQMRDGRLVAAGR
ncbi:ABC transporter ATP-binding protein [Pseudomarimonas arenosa]|uniref:ABC transporter ATP-binding protein n=1 Tax=Pseudomarimonas arenosa TaxID=2774145 RepID=A0AAW3ZRA1_9GAMM|nr:ABC transporter ATP-binding protein [Pseudomarimonas arenosa]MBD8528065.1 ABC transporter ATP-binding protein [Pseudomarimonas arenosa]